MMYCKYCDYYSEMGGKPESAETKAYCEFADYIFTSDVEDIDIENPCKGITYQDYLNSMHEGLRIRVSA
ncbi:MAG: hypothetical protein K0R19_1695 [Bacillota bacterium]|nr:hypothetical protein [Bacillota bacterium]